VTGTNRAVTRWLYSGCLLIALLVTVGGITRLTGSGLSITEWNLLMGALPPLSDTAWQELWQKYQATPQYQQVNTHFSLDEFKTIFWWEYIHRLLARLLGFVFLIPFAWFWARGYFDRALRNRVLLIFGLGAFQGVLGWLMVASGLVDRPSVSHLRLAAHLMTALLTFSVTLWTALETEGRTDGPTDRVRRQHWRPLTVFATLLVLQLTYGAFVAGLNAGGIYNTFPLMGGSLFPPGGGSLSPWIRNLFENPATVQFIHRVLGTVLLIFGLLLWRSLRRDGLRGAGAELGGAVLLQFVLGVFTILRWPSSPVFWGAVHQAGAVVLLAATVRTLDTVRRA
jgi:cytochrome c oxidase assembly protein subunit 15